MKKHQIEFLFPIALFFFFTLSALVVILFAARVYQSTIRDAAVNYNANTSLAYVREKVHRHDSAGAVSITEFGGCKALRLAEDVNGMEFATYIYQYDGSLREVFIQSGNEASVSAESGMEILPVQEFDVTLNNDRLLYFSCTDTDGAVASAYVGIYAEE